MGSEKLSECEKLANLYTAKTRAMKLSRWIPKIRAKHLSAATKGWTNNRTGSKKWKMSLQSCQR